MTGGVAAPPNATANAIANATANAAANATANATVVDADTANTAAAAVTSPITASPPPTANKKRKPADNGDGVPLGGGGAAPPSATATTETVDPRPSYLDYLHENNPNKKSRKHAHDQCVIEHHNIKSILPLNSVPSEWSPLELLVYLQLKNMKKYCNYTEIDVEELIGMIQ